MNAVFAIHPGAEMNAVFATHPLETGLGLEEIRYPQMGMVSLFWVWDLSILLLEIHCRDCYTIFLIIFGWPPTRSLLYSKYRSRPALLTWMLVPYIHSSDKELIQHPFKHQLIVLIYETYSRAQKGKFFLIGYFWILRFRATFFHLYDSQAPIIIKQIASPSNANDAEASLWTSNINRHEEDNILRRGNKFARHPDCRCCGKSDTVEILLLISKVSGV